MPARRIAPLLLALLMSALPAPAIETDQFYAWDRELPDSSAVLSAKVNVEILAVLEQVNSESSWSEQSCHDVAIRIQRRFRLFIFHDLELWANNSSLVNRVPATGEEELRYRDEYLYSNHGVFDPGTWMPPSPTIEVGGVRFGTDKLTHFFSEGWMAFKWYQGGIRQGWTPEEAERDAIERGIRLENGLLGTVVSGVLSLADLEANHAGMLFYLGLCDEDGPALKKTDRGWELTELFDFFRYVTPEWDESYQPSILAEGRWAKVYPVMLQYCPLLHSPQVVRQREAYAARDRVTATERLIAKMVEQGKLVDPALYGIEQVCAEAAVAAREIQRESASPSD